MRIENIMKSQMVVCAVLTALVSCLSYGHAAYGEFSPPSAFGWRQGVPLRLLDCDAVRSDLGLDPQTIDKLRILETQIEAEACTELLKTWQGGKYKSLNDVPLNLQQLIRGLLKFNRNMIREIQSNYQHQIDELLTREQQARLHEIDLQSAGIDALADPDFAQELALSSQQKRSIVRLYWELHKQQVKPSKSAVKPFSEQMNEILNAEQKEVFERLKGKQLEPIDAKNSAQLQSLRWNMGKSKLFQEFPVR